MPGGEQQPVQAPGPDQRRVVGRSRAAGPPTSRRARARRSRGAPGRPLAAARERRPRSPGRRSPAPPPSPRRPPGHPGGARRRRAPWRRSARMAWSPALPRRVRICPLTGRTGGRASGGKPWRRFRTTRPVARTTRSARCSRPSAVTTPTRRPRSTSASATSASIEHLAAPVLHRGSERRDQRSRVDRGLVRGVDAARRTQGRAPARAPGIRGRGATPPRGRGTPSARTAAEAPPTRRGRARRAARRRRHSRPRARCPPRAPTRTSARRAPRRSPSASARPRPSSPRRRAPASRRRRPTRQRRAHRAPGPGPEARGGPRATRTRARSSRRRRRSRRALPARRRRPGLRSGTTTSPLVARPVRCRRGTVAFSPIAGTPGGRSAPPSLRRHYPDQVQTVGGRMPPSQPVFEGSRCGSMVLRRLRDSRACRSTEHTACDGSAPRGSTSSATACRRAGSLRTARRRAARRGGHRPDAREGARCAEELVSLADPFRRAADGARRAVHPQRPSRPGRGLRRRRRPRRPGGHARGRGARSSPGPTALIGLSTHSPEQVEAACAAAGDDRPDQISVGPVWETPTKAGRPATGLGLIELAAREATIPWFAIGGIDVGNVAEVVAAGASRIVVVRAIRDADDPEARRPRPARQRWTTRPAPRPPSRRAERMASRERKRTERQKRKARSSERRAEVAARYEERNRAARETLEPLAPTERPVVVTVGAVISGLVALSVLVAYAVGATVNGDRPHLLQVIVPGAPHGRDGDRDVARPLLGGARISGGPRPPAPGREPRSAQRRRAWPR